ncbi:hypothetical protein O181_006512 [Austropuccinia psidii MF-1]|uniref:Uncharacterized protein n=1 Tax=Austropuccinia psidii MF-1 TaxID=1389203 RepID=A0A9Q3GHN6_9BASI|nr:hypothetical protein [Austropuccinia psidii MF-1]
MPQPLKSTTRFSSQLNKLPTSSLGSGSELSDMDGINELGIEVEILTPENNQDQPVLPKFSNLSKNTFEKL